MIGNISIAELYSRDPRAEVKTGSGSPGTPGSCARRGNHRHLVCYFSSRYGSVNIELLKSIIPRFRMRFRQLCILALGVALSGSALAAVHQPASLASHHRRAHAHRATHARRTPHARHTAVHRAALHSAAYQPASLTERIPYVRPLRGSMASLLRQNRRNDEEGLVRIEDTAQLLQLEDDRAIVPVPASSGLRVNPDLPMDRRYCRPWTARFLTDLARSHYQRFHRPFQVNSAVRTVAFQRSLLEINGNAAPAEGDIASPHLTGAAIDIGKRGMSFSEIAWMRAHLLPLQTAGKIDVEEEFYQSCFHITVYRSYAPPAPPRLIAKRHRSTGTLLAASLH
jgi:hypothetical protein